MLVHVTYPPFTGWLILLWLICRRPVHMKGVTPLSVTRPFIHKGGEEQPREVSCLRTLECTCQSWTRHPSRCPAQGASPAHSITKTVVVKFLGLLGRIFSEYDLPSSELPGALLKFIYWGYTQNLLDHNL